MAHGHDGGAGGARYDGLLAASKGAAARSGATQLTRGSTKYVMRYDEMLNAIAKAKQARSARHGAVPPHPRPLAVARPCFMPSVHSLRRHPHETHTSSVSQQYAHHACGAHARARTHTAGA